MAGLIPARAGKTTVERPSPTGSPAHPRACGENFFGAFCGVVARGSSPRVRGKHGRDTLAFHPARLIPARAGKTSSPPPVQRTPPAHPRACGENSANISTIQATYGSSPRVRGKQDRPTRRAPVAGLIPARAGKT